MTFYNAVKLRLPIASSLAFIEVLGKPHRQKPRHRSLTWEVSWLPWV
jgi:hypothetical protein